MSGLEVFLIVLLVLAVLAGVIVAIYFILRHDNKKNNPPASSGGGTNTGGGGGATGPVETRPNPPNMNPIPDTAFASSQTVGGSTLVWGVITNPQNPGLSPSLTATASIPGFPCKNYLFNLENGLLTWQGDGTSVVIGSLTPEGSVLVVDPQSIPESGFTSNWVYNETAQTWCAQENPNLCIQYLPRNLPGAVPVVMNTLTTDPSFQWNRVSSLPDTNIPCSTAT